METKTFFKRFYSQLALTNDYPRLNAKTKSKLDKIAYAIQEPEVEAAGAGEVSLIDSQKKGYFLGMLLDKKGELATKAVHVFKAENKDEYSASTLCDDELDNEKYQFYQIINNYNERDIRFLSAVVFDAAKKARVHICGNCVRKLYG